MYVYQQQRGARILQRGLISHLLLPRQAGQLLPHEDVSNHVARQRAAHMSGLRAQLEPLLPAHRGTASTTAHLVDHTTRRTPVAVARTGQITHVLWACDDPAELSLLAGGLSVGQALIADGHHRHAACLQLSGDAAGPWSSSLTLLVDTVTSPLRLSAFPPTGAGPGTGEGRSACSPTATVADSKPPPPLFPRDLVAKLDFRRQQPCSSAIACNGAPPRGSCRTPQLVMLRAVI
ncbi:DUF1015 family protein [Streptomyces sp. NPDC006265]|uniref:DUF1015 family protein n=1 Tax=Streptomyces sp. NPDC006265 TaxID=3156740 RepID=UPI0033AC1188